jgi:hypothetical protein
MLISLLLGKNKMKKIILMLIFVSHPLYANSLLELSDDQFKRLLGTGIPDECVRYYLGDMSELLDSVSQLKVIDIPGQAARKASEDEKQTTLNELMISLEKRCYQDVKRTIVTNNYYKDMPKDLYADDFSDKRVLDRYIKLIGLDK